MTCDDSNIGRLVGYFESGIKPKGEGALGVELEHFVVGKRGFFPVFCDDVFGSLAIVRRLYDELSAHSHVNPVLEDGVLLGFDADDYSVSLEPAGQVEISIKATADIGWIAVAYDDFRKRMERILVGGDLALVNAGYMPNGKASAMRLIPKERYRRMLRHFASTGKYGENMMKGTASLQVSIDYFSEADFRMKYRVGIKLMPVLKLLAVNSPMFEGRSNSNCLIRTMIWNGTDPKRCSYPSKAFSDCFSFADYAEYALDQKMIYYPFGEYGGTDISVRDFFAGRNMSDDDVSFVLSMVFPEIRLKRCLELRGMDSLRLDRALHVLALIKGLFYNAEALEHVDGMLSADPDALEETEASISSKGWCGTVFGYDAKALADELMSVACDGLEGDDKRILSTFQSGFRSHNGMLIR